MTPAEVRPLAKPASGKRRRPTALFLSAPVLFCLPVPKAAAGACSPQPETLGRDASALVRSPALELRSRSKLEIVRALLAGFGFFGWLAACRAFAFDKR